MPKKRNLLEEELQTFQNEIGNLSFNKKMELYFSLSPILQKDMEERRRILFNSLTDRERMKYYNIFKPILEAIQEYEDRLRTLKVNSDFYNYFICSVLRQRNTLISFRDFLNGLIAKSQGAPTELSEEIEKFYLRIPLDLQTPYQLDFDSTSGFYKVNLDNLEDTVKGSTKTLRKILSALKTYLSTLQDFLESVNYPQYFPEEFKRMKNELESTYRGDLFTKIDENICGAEREFLLIDFQTLPLLQEITGEGNLWKKCYERTINTK